MGPRTRRRRLSRLLAATAVILLLTIPAGNRASAEEAEPSTAAPRLQVGKSSEAAQRLRVAKPSETAQPLTAKVSGGSWTEKGPAPAQNNQPENIPNSPISGAIEAVAAHPTNPDVLWIGAVNGGIFRTDDATMASPTWTQQTDTQASLSIAALELDPTDLTDPRTLVAGIGRTSSFARQGGSRTGLLRTTDGGASWTPLTSLAGKDVTGVAPRGSVIVAAVDAADSPPAFCSDTGIFRSTDGGATFNSVSSGTFCGFSFDLAGNPLDNAQLYTDHTRGTFDGIFRSDDTGLTWAKVSNAAIDAQLATASRVEIAVGRAGAGAAANVFVAISNAIGQLSGLFRSGNAGATWTTLPLPMTSEPAGFPLGIHPGGQGSIHLSLVADPANHNVVFIGGDRQPHGMEGNGGPQTFPNSIAASTFGGRLFRVDAGALPGTPITNCPVATVACGGAVRTVSDTAPHADSREMVFDANGDLVQTDDGGIYKHTDPNGSTGDWVSLIGDLRVVEQHDSEYDSVSDILISGNQDNGVTLQNTPPSLVWDTLLIGDGGDIGVFEGDPIAGQSTRYQSNQFLFNLLRIVYDSNNVLQSFVFPTLTPVGVSPPPIALFTTPIAVNAVDPTRVLLGASNGLYESMDRLNSVNQLIPAFQVSYPLGGNPIAYGAVGDPAAFYFVKSDEVFSFTAATAPTVVQRNPDAGDNDPAVGVVMDPDNSSAAFFVDTDQVFRTTDSGNTWTEITGNLGVFTPGALRSVEYIASAAGDSVVVGSNTGVFVAPANSGFTIWDRLGSGLPNAPAYDLDYDPADDVLAAGTLGRGAWTLGSASRLCVEAINLVPGQWKQISLVCDPGAANTVADVFGDDLAGVYDTDWVVVRRDAAAQANVRLATTDALNVGEGYWIRTDLAAQSVGIQAGNNLVTDIALATDAADPPAGCGSSAGRCGMAGHPHKFEVCWADALVIDGPSTLSLAGADPAGACQAANAAVNGCVMSRIAHKWTGASYAPFDGQTMGMEGTLVPWDGFWVSALKSGIELRVPTSAGNCGAPARSVGPAGWFVRLIVESANLRDVSNVLGQLSDSVFGYDSHDLEELAPFGSPFLTVVFPHPDWGDKAGDYASDYHPPSPEGIQDVWRFEVRSSDPVAAVTLRWEGPNARLLASVLVDEETGQQVAPAPDGSYSFTMTGTSRSFQWTLQGASDLIFADGFESGDTSNW